MTKDQYVISKWLHGIPRQDVWRLYLNAHDWDICDNRTAIPILINGKPILTPKGTSTDAKTWIKRASRVWWEE